MTADSQSSKELNTALSEKECREYRTIFRHTPEVLQIELTDRCNAGCIMCSHYYKKNIGAGDLRDGVLEKIEPLLENCRLMLLNGYGEPFISGKYRQCMDLLKRYDVNAGSKRIGIAKGRRLAPDDINKYDDEVATLFGVEI